MAEGERVPLAIAPQTKCRARWFFGQILPLGRISQNEIGHKMWLHAHFGPILPLVVFGLARLPLRFC